MSGPRWAEWLVRASAGAAEADWVLAELDAEQRTRREREGEAAAARWYAVQALRSALPLLGRRLERWKRGRQRMEIVRDIRYAVRSWLRTPLFTLLAVGMLALGMGSTLAVFSVVNGVLLAPLEYPDWERLAHVEGSPGARFGVSYPVIEDVRTGSTLLEDVVAWQGWWLVLRDEEDTPVRRNAASVSANFFRVLGAEPALGRLFGPADEPPRHEPVVVLSFGLWRSVYGGAAAVVGRTIRVDSVAYTIVGVAPEGFRDPVASAIPTSQPVLWRSSPESFDATASDRGWVGFWAFGRLRPGATPEAAGAEVRRLVRAAIPDAESDPDLAVATFRERQVREIRPTLMLLFAAVAGVLLIACANLANLLLSRASGRVREVVVRASLGAPRGRLLAQLMTETLVLCLAGGVAGLGMAWLGGTAIVRLAGGGLPTGAAMDVDGRVVAFAFALSIASALLAGLVPALRLTDTRLAEALHSVSRSGLASRRGQRFRATLVIAETALAVMLLSGAGLLLRTAWNLLHTDPGFDPTPVLTTQVAMLPEAFPTAASQTSGLTHALDEVRGLPGVLVASAISDLPMSGAVNSTPVRDTRRPDERGVQTLVRTVMPDFFEVMDIALARGRALGAGDGAGGREVAVINRTLAARLLPGEDPIGRTVTVRGLTREVVGVVEDVTEFTLADGPDPVLYTPFPQEPQAWMREQMTVVVRTAGDPARFAGAIRSALRSAEPLMSVAPPQPMRAYLDRDTAEPRFRALLVAVFAALALVLAAAGTGGLAAYTVSRRLPEMGLRMALGATPREVASLVLRQAASLTLLGVALGVAGALATMRLVAGFLVGVPATDPVALTVAAVSLAAIGIGSSWPPAARAARADPARTLSDGR